MSQEIRLLVGDVKRMDVGKGVARIDQGTMKKLGISMGNVVEIVGKRTTSAIAEPAYNEDENKEIIRIDSFTRKNANIAINEYVMIRPAKVKNALKITLAPVDMKLNVDNDFINFVKNRLVERTLVEGDTTVVMMLNHAIPFTITKTHPSGIVEVTKETQLTILNEPQPEKRGLLRTTYEDIGGLHEEIQRVKEIVEFPLRYPELFQRLGIEPPKGVLLHGPPGCGKTVLARAVANESEANFFAIDGPEIMGKFYGESEARLREVFNQAQQNAPSIIFIDHIDAIATLRRLDNKDLLENRLVDQLLALTDGLKSRGSVILIAATDRIDLIDPALRRPGRFDVEIEIGLPDKHARYEIMKIHTRGMPLAENVDVNKLAEMSEGYTGADLMALCREAAMKCLRRCLREGNLMEGQIPPEVLERITVLMEDFLDAFNVFRPTLKR